MTSVLLIVIIIFVIVIILLLLAFCKYRKSLVSTKKIDDIANTISKNGEQRKSQKLAVVERSVMPVAPARNHTVLGISDAQI